MFSAGSNIQTHISMLAVVNSSLFVFFSYHNSDVIFIYTPNNTYRLLLRVLPATYCGVSSPTSTAVTQNDQGHF